MILEPRKMNSATVYPSVSHEVMGPDAMILVFWMLNFKPAFSLFSFTFIKRLFSSSSLSAIRVVYPSNLDSSLCFLQPSVSHDVLCILSHCFGSYRRSPSCLSVFLLHDESQLDRAYWSRDALRRLPVCFSGLHALVLFSQVPASHRAWLRHLPVLLGRMPWCAGPQWAGH